MNLRNALFAGFGLLIVISLFRYLPWWAWMIVLFVLLPMLMRSIRRMTDGFSRGWGHQGNAWSQWGRDMGHRYGDMYGGKAKRGYTPERAADDDLPDEKRKNRPVYVVGDDGELVELTDDDVAPNGKRKNSSGGPYTYV